MQTVNVSPAAGPTLVVLAAGIGSRYGGFKQIDPLGENGEIPLDYACYDAWRAGFRKVVLVIRPELEAPIRQHFGARLDGRLAVECVFQDLHDVPAEFQVPADRRKPWGTGHAVLAARGVVREPFAVINADDFYGAGSYRALAGFLGSAPMAASPAEFAMVGYPVRQTLSPHGAVSRGVCDVSAEGFLREVVERTQIGMHEGRLSYQADGRWEPLTGEEIVSLNCWGFTPQIFACLEAQFAEFLRLRGQEAKAEFFMPTVVDQELHAGRCRVRVLPTSESWFGMTYPEDRPGVQASIRKLTAAGVYPSPLWAAG